MDMVKYAARHKRYFINIRATNNHYMDFPYENGMIISVQQFAITSGYYKFIWQVDYD
jgi:hypothetical protein